MDNDLRPLAFLELIRELLLLLQDTRRSSKLRCDDETNS